MGVFYDNECTIKTKHDSPAMGYYKFNTVAGGCVNYAEENIVEMCKDMYSNPYHCFLGKDQMG